MMAKKGFGTDGWKKLEDGRVVGSIVCPDWDDASELIRLVIVAEDRKAVVGRAKDLGVHGLHLVENERRPTDDEVSAVLDSGSDAVWRPWAGSEGVWRPVN